MQAIAKLRNHPTSPTKMRLVADLIRGMGVEKALVELQFSTKHSSLPLRKLLLSAIDNWKQVNGESQAKELYIKAIFVNGARVLKRMLPAPQGRAYRIRKRSNHVTIVVDKRLEKEVTPSAGIDPKTYKGEAKTAEGKKSTQTKKKIISSKPKTTTNSSAKKELDEEVSTSKKTS